ncbi:MAG TPA: hypothetical protein DEG09_01025, partial [Marinilabiliaceae bacterium]|nr:hypothetical protein [Marinilabiliaceae bacterium]
SDYAYLYETMTHDKKNQQGRLNFTLLRSPGDIAINTHCDKDEIRESLDFYLMISANEKP